MLGSVSAASDRAGCFAARLEESPEESPEEEWKMTQRDAARTPVIVGIGQSIEREQLVTPIDLAERAARAAFEDAPGLEGRIDRVSMVAAIFSPAGKAPASAVADRLGLRRAKREVSTVGGNTPQWLVTSLASQIAAGELGTALVVGAEATRSLLQSNPGADFMRGAGASAAAGGDATADPVVGPSSEGMVGPAEIAAGLVRPAEVYALFESALAAAAGRSPLAQREYLGRLLAPFTRVAAENPFAWFPKALSADEIARPSDKNRLTAEPYSKRMNSFPNVDQGTALIVTSLEIARQAGLEQQAIFVWGGATNADVPPTARRELGASPAIHAASRALFDATGVGIDDCDFIDLYSCFPSAVEAGAAAIGLALDDKRGLTQTGGMPFFGGPGNNYTSHAIVSVVARLRRSGRLGYVAGNGGFLSKHSLGVYGSERPPRGFVRVDTSRQQAEIDAAALPLAVDANGIATVAGGTVVYGRDGAVASAPIVATFDDGRRTAAQADQAELAGLAGRSLVGARVRVAGSPPRYRLA